MTHSLCATPEPFSEPIHPHLLFVIPVLSHPAAAVQKGSRARRKVKREAEV
jgi:hypothetical protein